MHRAKQRIDKDLVILLNGLRVYAAVPGDVRIVRQLSVRISHGIEEPRKGGDITGQSLIEHLLLEIIPNISLQRLAIFLLHEVHRYHSPVERSEQIKVSHLCRERGCIS